MALSPITSPSRAVLVNSSRIDSEIQQLKVTEEISNVTDITSSIDSVKKSSLLYQLISRLLLQPTENEQLQEDLSQSDGLINSDFNDKPLENITDIKSSVNFQLDFSMINIEHQTLTFTFENTTMILEATVFEAFFFTADVMLEEDVQESDPIIFDLNGDGFNTTGVKDGALFDINADGVLDQVSMVTDDDAFLALDINNNGLIDDGSELFGDQTGYANGFEYLASFDDNNDGVINANDQIFNSLLMMRLVDNQQFLTALSDTDVSDINLGYREIDQLNNNNDRIVQISEFKTSSGQKGAVADLMLKYKSGISNE